MSKISSTKDCQRIANSGLVSFIFLCFSSQAHSAQIKNRWEGWRLVKSEIGFFQSPVHNTEPKRRVSMWLAKPSIIAFVARGLEGCLFSHGRPPASGAFTSQPRLYAQPFLVLTSVCVGTMFKAWKLSGYLQSCWPRSDGKVNLACPLHARWQKPLIHCLSGLTWVEMSSQKERQWSFVPIMRSWLHQMMISRGLELGRRVEWEKRTEDGTSIQHLRRLTNSANWIPSKRSPPC